ncbi:MAG: Hsp20/alpha crystallin family protein [Rubinisphaera brasiliensis]|uniref:Hsp20/alpha crystallin family protein n=1 Tax=Rubinisphaera brasiliensis TaxID=119 RepID=UPI00391D1D5A
MMLTSSRHSALFPASLERLQRELHDSLVEFQNGLRATQGLLATNIWAKEDEILIRLELPGLDRNQIGIDIKENRVTLTTPDRKETDPGDGKWLRKERDLSATQRELQLPFPVDAESSEAVYEGGVLQLKLKSARPAEGYRLAVKGSDQPESQN